MRFDSLLLCGLSFFGYGSAQLTTVPHRMRNNIIGSKRMSSEEWGRRVFKTIQSNPNHNRLLAESLSMPILENSMPTAYEIEESLPETESSLPMLVSMPDFGPADDVAKDDYDELDNVAEGTDITDSTVTGADNISPTPAQGEHKEAIEEPESRSSDATLALPGLLSAACAIGSYSLISLML
ncbi:hypothetical protein ACHAXS_007121 [Conticribra weissflogii]